MNTTAKIGFSCGLGGLVGAVVALEVASAFSLGDYFAIVGFFAGGMVSYLAFEFRAVLSALGRAWTELRGWRPDWRTFGSRLLASFLLSAIIASYLSVLMILGLISSPESAGASPLSPGFLVAIPLCTLIPMFFSYTDDKGKDNTYRVKNTEDLWAAVRVMNPFFVLLCISRGIIRLTIRIPRAMVVTGRRIIWGIVFLPRVTAKTFRYIYSELRVLCFVGGTLGAAAGYFLGWPFAGLAAGLSFGVLNYLIVKQWLLGIGKSRV